MVWNAHGEVLGIVTSPDLVKAIARGADDAKDRNSSPESVSCASNRSAASDRIARLVTRMALIAHAPRPRRRTFRRTPIR
jgi:hypothetical protein